MAWNIKISDIAAKQIDALDNSVKKRILNYLYEKIDGCQNPRHFGKGLIANKSGLWRYRVGDYRIISEIKDYELIVLVVTIGHRKDAYGD